MNELEIRDEIVLRVARGIFYADYDGYEGGPHKWEDHSDEHGAYFKMAHGAVSALRDIL